MTGEPIEVLDRGARTAIAVLTSMTDDNATQVVDLLKDVDDNELGSVVLVLARLCDVLILELSDCTDTDPDDILRGIALDVERQLEGLQP